MDGADSIVNKCAVPKQFYKLSEYYCVGIGWMLKGQCHKICYHHFCSSLFYPIQVPYSYAEVFRTWVWWRGDYVFACAKKLRSFSKKISSNLKSQFKLKQKLRSVIIHYEEFYVTLRSHDLVAFKEIIW